MPDGRIFREIAYADIYRNMKIGKYQPKMKYLQEISMAATLNDTVKLSKIKELTAEEYTRFLKSSKPR